jgi:hypothetical protein
MYHLAIDASGNVWGVTADSVTSSGGTPTGTTGNLIEISPTGTPLTCGLGTLASATGSAAIDPNGRVWVAPRVLNAAATSLRW